MTESTTRDVLTLRARQHPIEPAIGMLMASGGGGRVYRIVGVVKLARAGDPRGHRYRLTCERAHEIPVGAVVHPWMLSGPVARRPRCDVPVRPRPEPQVSTAIRAARERERQAQLDRARRVGLDHGVIDLVDFGPGAQLVPVRSRGRVIREPLVAIEREVVDPERPGRRLGRRARRVDRLNALLAARTITQQQYDAAERLRNDVERGQKLRGGVGFGAPHVDCSPAPGVPIGPIRAWRAAKSALQAIGSAERALVVWVVLEGRTLDEYAADAHLRRSTAPELLSAGLTQLADHYFFGPASRRQLERVSGS